MVLKYEIVSDRDVLVDAIGLLEADKPVEVTAEMLQMFEILNGVSLLGANLPSFVQVTTIVEAPAEK
jgi:hypothetical protein